MTKYWKINDNYEIEALIDFWYIKKGQKGGYVKPCTKLPDQMTPFWIGNNVKIGNNVEMGNNVKIGDYVEIGNDVEIGNNVKIGDYVEMGNNVEIGNWVKIGYNVKIGNDVEMGYNVKIGDYVEMGNNVEIGDYVKIGDYVEMGNNVEIGNWVKMGSNIEIGNWVEINNTNYMQLSNQGTSHRNVFFHTQNGVVLVSVGCQASIQFEDFIDRINSAKGTSKESAEMYKNNINLYEMIRDKLLENNP